MHTVLRLEVPVTAAGRTDAGVNARVMYAHFDVESPVADAALLVRQLNSLLGPDIQLIDTGAAVARQTRRVLQAQGMLATEPAASGPELELAPSAQVRLATTGSLYALQAAAERWLAIGSAQCRATQVADR